MKQHYDICVLGFWAGENYGSLLNGYAVYKLLKDLGKEVLMLTPKTESVSVHNQHFIEKYYDHDDIINTLGLDEFGKINEICDCFCTCSDQTWNYNLSFRENLFLPFATNDKKLISFSTSFGHKKDFTPAEAKSRIGNYLKRYGTISVRENFCVDMLHNYGVDSTVVLEPTLCVQHSVYENMADSSVFQTDEPYLVTYILDPTPQKREAVLYYSQKLGIRAINILNGTRRVFEKNKQLLDLPNCPDNVLVDDFLKAIQNARFVITDSFHGTIFSIVFNTPFLSIGNRGRGYDRFIDLLDRMKLRDRFVSPEKIIFDEKYLEPFSFDATNAAIEIEAKKSIQWLKDTTLNTTSPNAETVSKMYRIAELHAGIVGGKLNSTTAEIYRKIDDVASVLEQKIDMVAEQRDRLQYDLDCVHRSVSFRLGRKITWFPRKVRGGIRCLKEHGFAYTWKRFWEKVANKLRW